MRHIGVDNPKRMNRDRFLNILLPLQPAMQLLAEKMLHSAADAEDAVQDVFLELREKRNNLQHVFHLERYAMQSVKYHCISMLRKQKEILPNIQGDICDEEIHAEAALIEERAAQFDNMMSHLPEVQRQAVQMRYIDCLSHEEMQRRLGMSSTNVYATLSRAVSALKSMSHGR